MKTTTALNSSVRTALVRSALACSLVLSASATLADPEKGRELYIKNGCWQCHGFVGQGGITGPKLAPEPKPFDFLNPCPSTAKRFCPRKICLRSTAIWRPSPSRQGTKTLVCSNSFKAVEFMKN
jgi:hypothetical protein